MTPLTSHTLDFPGDTFRVLKEKEEKQFGEYRKRRRVLEEWERQGNPARRYRSTSSRDCSRRRNDGFVDMAMGLLGVGGLWSAVPTPIHLKAEAIKGRRNEIKGSLVRDDLDWLASPGKAIGEDLRAQLK